MAAIFFDDTDDLIDIRLDNVLKAVFARDIPASKGALSKLISALIGQEISIITLSANEPPADNIHDRQIRFDLHRKAIGTPIGQIVRITGLTEQQIQEL